MDYLPARGERIETFEIDRRYRVQHSSDPVLAWRVEPSGVLTAVAVNGPLLPAQPDSEFFRASYIVTRAGRWSHYTHRAGVLTTDSHLELQSVALHCAQRWHWKRVA